MPSYKGLILISLVFSETKGFHHGKLAYEKYVFNNTNDIEKLRILENI